MFQAVIDILEIQLVSGLITFSRANLLEGGGGQTDDGKTAVIG